MPTVTWATVASTNPMGQQRYEFEVQRAIREVAGQTWSFVDLPVGSLRGGIPGARRSPVRLTDRSPLPAALAIGAMTYRRRGLVHRFDLRLPPHPGREVLTVHDTAPLRFDDEGTLPVSTAGSIRRARVVICPSDFSASEIRRSFEVERIEVIPNGLSEVFSKPEPLGDQRLSELGITGAFILHAGGATARKNLGALASAWGSIQSQHPELRLVLCGPDDPRRNQAFAGLPRVHTLGKVASTDLVGLMCRADVVVVPSVYEGFGLPALEAMACGTPVVASCAGSLPEVCGDTAELVEPTADGIAAGLRRTLEDPDRARIRTQAARERALTFSWQEAARAHLRVYAAAAA